jgi:chemotaxis methyl-accepting protein methylase
LDPFILWLFQRAGIAADAYRQTALQRRLPACLRALRTSSTQQARAIVEQHPALLQQAISAILIGVSEFFRDPQVWDYLQARLLPPFIRQRHTLRVYSAGCSEGQELYSIAMLLDELDALERSVLLGEDCRPDAVARAQAGVYEAADMEGVPVSRRERYFRKAGCQYGIVPRLRDHVRWGVRDLFGLHAPGGWDILLFRNVGIYLESDQVDLLWKRLCGQLTPGGILVTGKAERPPAVLPLRRLSTCIYQNSDG